MFDIMEDFVMRTSKQIVTEHDDLLFSWLAPYGVTRENWREYTSRLLYETMADGSVQHWFLDGCYIFSVATITEWNHSEDGLHWSCNVTYKQFHREKEFDPEQED